MANYVFATAMIRSMEKRLISAEKFNALIDSGTIEDICRAIQDAGYGSDADPVTLESYQRLMSEQEHHIFDDTLKSCGDFRLLDIPAFQNDYHNMKVLLKAEALGVDRSDILMESGTLSAEKMVELVRDRNRAELTENMYKALMEASEALARTGDPQQVDIICDRYWYADMLNTAEQCRNDYAINYVKLRIDLANLKTYARVRRMGEGWPYLSTMFVDGGTVTASTYQKAYAEDYETFATHFKGTNLYKAARDGFESMAKSGAFTEFEKYLDNAVVEYIKEGRYVSYGIEVVFSFLIAKYNEMTNIRILMASKLAGSSPEMIKERMRATYE